MQKEKARGRLGNAHHQNEKPVEQMLDGSYHLIFVLSPVFAGEANYLVHGTIPQIAVYNLLKYLSTLEFTL